MASVNYGQYTYTKSFYGSPQYEVAEATISVNSSVASVASCEFTLQDETITATSAVTSSINRKYNGAASIAGVSDLEAECQGVRISIPNPLIQNSGATASGIQIDQAGVFITGTTAIDVVGTQIDLVGQQDITVSSGATIVGTKIKLGATALTENSSLQASGLQIDLGFATMGDTASFVIVGTQIDLGASAILATSNRVLTLNPLFQSNSFDIVVNTLANSFMVEGVDNGTPEIFDNFTTTLRQDDATNSNNRIKVATVANGRHNTTDDHISIATDQAGNTYVQFLGGEVGTNPGGYQIAENSTLYYYSGDTLGGSPSYTGNGWAYVYADSSVSIDPGFTGTLSIVPVTGTSPQKYALTINGYPVYQYANDYDDTTANGVQPSMWMAIQADGTAQPNSPVGAFTSSIDLPGVVSYVGTPGLFGAKTIINTVPSTPSTLYYYSESALTGGTTTYNVTVQAGSNAYGSGNKYIINGTASPGLTLNYGQTYIFDQSDPSNAGHPLRFSETANGTHAVGGSEYTTDVTTYGTPGTPGAYTRIVVTNSTPDLHYYCTNHSGMGAQANTQAPSQLSSVSGGIITKGTELSGVESVFNLIGAGLIGVNSGLTSAGVRRYFGVANFLSTSSVQADGGVKWNLQAVPDENWTEQRLQRTA